MNCVIADINKSELVSIKGLWEELTKIHMEDSVFFKEHYKAFTFEQRIKAFTGLADEKIKISVVKNEHTICGYCISSIHGDKGEIESLYLINEIRKEKYGKLLVQQHIEWLETNRCKKIIVTVSHGHESVLGFYHKMGFFERLIQLEYTRNIS